LEQKRKPKLIRLLIFIALILLVASGFYYFSKSRTSDKPASATEIKTNSANETPQESKPAEIAKTTFAFGGDLMFDRNVWHKYKDIGLNRIFDNLDIAIFKNSDIAFANLEGPISAGEINDDYLSGSMNFNFPPETIDTLKYLGLNIVSLSNNHTMNAGTNGFANTKKVLSESEIKYSGSQNDFDSTNIVELETKIPIAIITADILVGLDNSEIVNSIKAEVIKGERVIIIPHWGVEYQSIHNKTQENMAKSWIDAGATMVIGGHPHVVQDVQVYNNRPIIYSLGNFVFDQFFSPETQQGLIISGDIDESSMTLKFSPFTSTNVKPALDTGSTKLARIKAIFPDDEEFNSLKIADDSIKIDLTK